MFETLYLNDSVDFNNIRKKLYFMMLFKNYTIGFAILILIDLFGRATLVKDEEEINYEDYSGTESLLSKSVVSVEEDVGETKPTRGDSISNR